MKEKNMKSQVLIITSVGFPEGGAVANRIYTIAKGLSLNRIECIVLVNRNTENKYNAINPTFLKNDHFISLYPYKTNTRGHFVLKTLFIKAAFFLTTIKYLFNSRKTIKTYIIVTNSILSETLYFIISRLLGVVLIKDETEIPTIYFWKKSILNTLRKYIYLKLIYKYYDHIIVITDGLKGYFSTIQKISSKKISVIPMMVDIERFSVPYILKINDPYICYTGSINIKKDGVVQLIEAFSLIKDEYKSLRLFLVGGLVKGFESGLSDETLRELIIKKGLQNRVIVTGNVDRSLVVQYLLGAKILLLPRPLSLQASYGFPTKLGEYMVAGKPIVSTVFGEIEKLLEHLTNSYLIKDNQPQTIADALSLLLSNDEISRRIGQNALTTAQTRLDCKINVKPIIPIITKTEL